MRANVEAAIVAHLNTEGFSCFADVPEEPPPSYVTVDRTGGTHSEYVDSATVAIDCVAPSRYAASQLAIEVDDAMPALVSQPRISRVDKESIQNLSHIIEGMEGLYRLVYTVVSADVPQDNI
ncbi:MAG: hypothetical protein IJI35_04395 [Kiritimatiellae bacterium]|nr:hypothetical protein [Kiritimatiellia bacterium]